jgi:hypothetical protein
VRSGPIYTGDIHMPQANISTRDIDLRGDVILPF